MEKHCQNIDCNEILPKNRRKNCSQKCADRIYYLKNKEKIMEKVKEWEKNNPKKTKKKRKKSMDKFRREKPERFNELMRKQYHKHKDKWQSRNSTRKILNGTGTFKQYNPLKKQCKCGSINNLKICYDIYPTYVKDIKKALDDGKIYYKCSKCPRTQ